MMSLKNLAAGMLAIGFLAACQTTGDTYTTIADEAVFRDAVVGETLALRNNQSNRFMINDDGTVSGTWDGQELAGTWDWQDGAWCRSLDRWPDDCQRWEIAEDGQTMRVTRDRGNGPSFTYVIVEDGASG